ncbi:uncharacterized protein LOC132268617 [Cornus florida]|uniref:uncharacterized protein LOC132268617 n=1 Tax=Cornus florida TaxID=4283 RepID=UPI002898DA5F|nr:uncharacterized protein LOC132268617 [Cornus florida]
MKLSATPSISYLSATPSPTSDSLYLISLSDSLTSISHLSGTPSISHLWWVELIRDVNIAIAVEAIQAIGNLARGLRAHFSGSSRFLFPVLLYCAQDWLRASPNPVEIEETLEALEVVEQETLEAQNFL